MHGRKNTILKKLRMALERNWLIMVAKKRAIMILRVTVMKANSKVLMNAVLKFSSDSSLE